MNQLVVPQVSASVASLPLAGLSPAPPAIAASVSQAVERLLADAQKLSLVASGLHDAADAPTDRATALTQLQETLARFLGLPPQQRRDPEICGKLARAAETALESARGLNVAAGEDASRDQVAQGRPLGKGQVWVLRQLQDSSYPAGGWQWTTRGLTVDVLRTLCARGLARFDGTNYTMTAEGGRQIRSFISRRARK